MEQSLPASHDRAISLTDGMAAAVEGARRMLCFAEADDWNLLFGWGWRRYPDPSGLVSAPIDLGGATGYHPLCHPILDAFLLAEHTGMTNRSHVRSGNVDLGSS